MRFRSERGWRTLVAQQLKRLFDLAEVAVQEGDEALGRHYLNVARRMVLRTRVRVPRELRHRFCHRCGHLFRPGTNSRVRLRGEGQTKYLVITCLVCGFRQKLLWQPGKPKSLRQPAQESGGERRRG